MPRRDGFIINTEIVCQVAPDGELGLSEALGRALGSDFRSRSGWTSGRPKPWLWRWRSCHKVQIANPKGIQRQGDEET